METAQVRTGPDFRISIWDAFRSSHGGAPKCKEHITLPIKSTYGTRLRAAARSEFTNFWSSYRNWVWFASTCLVPIALQISRHGWRSVLQLNETLENGFIGLIVSLIGTYLIAVWKGAVAIDTEREVEFSALQNTVERLTPPKRSPLKQRQHDQTKASFDGLDQSAKTILLFLKHHTKITFRDLPGMGAQSQPISSLPRGMTPKAIRSSLDLCESMSLVSHSEELKIIVGVSSPFNEVTYYISDGATEALDELLV
jgi:hypothetical protein